ncbi:MAG: sterol desaturase/sphingolipid hydroxylase (fatty acid hydroxylase superfamily) [Candidatus Poriferisodalaceae bacterium]|jgi:sterol desaturase/sphingolipid hydroxylase (fatty acid hydroxylase superfamily)
MKAARTLLLVATGVAMWTFAEYCLHRWTFHPRKMRGWKRPTASEHLAHHSTPTRTSPFKRLLAWLLTASAGVPLVLLGPAGTAMLVGWGLGYTGYELLHWRTHHVRTGTRWEHRIRRRHYSHHFGQVRANYGVTVTWWDRAFGTLIEPSDVVDVPARHAPRWLLNEDEAGAVDGIRLTE